MAEKVDSANQEQIILGRAVEDLEIPLEDAIAARDLADESLDDLVRNVRVTLAGRGVDATKQRFYTLVFPDGIDEYTEADLSEQATRYTMLVQRLEVALQPDDPLRVETVPAVHAELARWKDAVALVSKAEADLEVARALREEGVVRWEQTMQATYGALLGLMSKARAERFFRKLSKPKAKKGRAPAPAPEPACPAPMDAEPDP